MSKRKAQPKPEATSAGPGPEFCYGVAKNLQGIVTLLPIVVKRGDRKALLHGIDEDGNLIGPYEGKRLLKALGIQTWLQASTLTPLKDKEKDRSTFWQRSLLLAIRQGDEGEDSFRYSSFCQDAYRGKLVELDVSLKPTLERARKLLRVNKKDHLKDYVATKETGGRAKRRKLAQVPLPLATPEALNTLLVVEREYQQQELPQQAQQQEREAVGEQQMEQSVGRDGSETVDPEPAEDASESQGRELVAYTPTNQALATSDHSLIATTGLPIVYSGVLKSRWREAEEASMEAAGEVHAREERKGQADMLLEETRAALEKAVAAHAAAEDSKRSAEEDLQKALAASEERDREKSAIQQIIDINRAEARKLLELFP